MGLPVAQETVGAADLTHVPMGSSPMIAQSLLPKVLPAASLQDIWIFSQEEDPAAFSAGSEGLREHLQSKCEQEDDSALSAAGLIQTHNCPVAMIFTFSFALV